LISHTFFDDKARTNSSARIFKERETVQVIPDSQSPACSSWDTGMKRTSLKPSKSVGTRRFLPQVSKS